MSFAVAALDVGAVDGDYQDEVGRIFQLIEEADELLESAVRRLEPGALDGQSAAMGVVFLNAIAKKAAAGMALCAARAAEAREFRRCGDRTPAHWLARVTGVSMAEALAALQVPDRLRALPETEKAFRDGELSLAQARHVTEAATADPSAEAALLETARREPLTVLREQAQRVAAAACEDAEARYRQVHDRRYLRHWTDGSGAFRLDASLTPDAGAEVLAALRPLRDKLSRQARRAGCRQPRDASAADALVELCRGGSATADGVRPRTTINIRVDAGAWDRGRTRQGETCEAEGAGPIPVTVAQQLAEGARVNVAGMDGADVVSLVSHTRYIPARVRRALLVRDPVCVVPGCYERDDLEFDHWQVDFVKSRRTSLGDLTRVCKFHHNLKTRLGWVLIGGPGNWQFLPPKLAERQRST